MRPLGLVVVSVSKHVRSSAPVIGFFVFLLGTVGLVFWSVSDVGDGFEPRQRPEQVAGLDEAALQEAREMESLGRMYAKVRDEWEADPRTVTVTVFNPPRTNQELADQDRWETECDMCRDCSGDHDEGASERRCTSFCQLGGHGALVKNYEGSGCLCKDGWHRWDRSHCYISPSFDCEPYGFDRKADPRFGMLHSWRKREGWGPGVCRWRRNAS